MKTILHLAVSVDGFIAKPNGNSDWVSSGDEKLFEERVKKAGAVIVGHTTYQQYRNKIYPIKDALNIVLSTKKGEPDIGVVVASTPAQAVALAEQKGKSEIVIAGGAKTAEAFLDEGLIDEIYLSIHPIVLHEGIRLSSDISRDSRYGLVGEKQLAEGVKELHYTVV